MNHTREDGTIHYAMNACYPDDSGWVSKNREQKLYSLYLKGHFTKHTYYMLRKAFWNKFSIQQSLNFIKLFEYEYV